MIFSIVCEELGIAGGVMLLLMFAYLLYRLFFIAQNASDLLGSLMVTGIFIHIALQVIFNVAVVLKSYAQYRSHPSVYQLRRNLHHVFDGRNGSCVKCRPADKISRHVRNNRQTKPGKEKIVEIY